MQMKSQPDKQRSIVRFLKMTDSENDRNDTSQNTDDFVAIKNRERLRDMAV